MPSIEYSPILAMPVTVHGMAPTVNHLSVENSLPCSLQAVSWWLFLFLSRYPTALAIQSRNAPGLVALHWISGRRCNVQNAIATAYH